VAQRAWIDPRPVRERPQARVRATGQEYLPREALHEPRTRLLMIAVARSRYSSHGWEY